MKINVSSSLVPCNALFVFIPEKKWTKGFSPKLLSSVLNTQISARFSQKDFEGELGEMLQIFPGQKGAQKTFLVGLGKNIKPTDIQKMAGKAIRKAKKIKANKVCFLCSDQVDVLRAISGGILGDYQFKIGDTKEHFSPKELHIASLQKLSPSEINSEIALNLATNFTRDLINLPANYITPKVLGNKAKEIGKGVGNKVKVNVYGEKEIKKLGMGSLFGVGQGSHEESQLIVLEYKGGKSSEAPLAFVGKGVCFDSGGYNLKPTNHIEEMKSDMAGAGTVLGLFQWISKVKPKKNIIGVIGAVENLVSGNAFKPGDVLTAMNGKTIEITNTDAEGRLVLADCLHYTVTKYKPSLMVDVATLTGAAIAAIGYEITGIMGNNKKALERVKKSASIAEEEVWELPITEHFREKVKGENSDLLNWTNGVSAGSSMGGAFLEYFVGQTPWVHCDVAGTAFHAKAETDICPKGATGVMMRTFKEVVMN